MNKSRPRVSIIVPVHNGERYMAECLESVVRQSLRDIECVCIDDASTDSSPRILAQFAALDGRIHVLSQPEIRSASQARKDGVFAASGEYVMFLDADDMLLPDACESLEAEIKRQNVDILQFRSCPINVGGVPASRFENLQRFLTPFPGRLEGDAILKACFLEKEFGFTLWNKIYSIDLCRLAFAHIPDGAFPKAQDLLAFFMLAYFARSFAGVDDAVYHRYRFGSGLTGRPHIDFDRFSVFCKQERVSAAIQTFLTSQGTLDTHMAELRQIRKDLLFECFWNWRRNLDQEDSVRGFELLLGTWGTADVLTLLVPSALNGPEESPKANHYATPPTWTEHARLLEELNTLKSSASYRLGSALLFPVRRIYEWCRKIQGG